MIIVNINLIYYSNDHITCKQIAVSWIEMSIESFYLNHEDYDYKVSSSFQETRFNFHLLIIKLSAVKTDIPILPRLDSDPTQFSNSLDKSSIEGLSIFGPSQNSFIGPSVR